MVCQKMKKYLYRGLSVFMGLYLSLCSCIGSYASDSTSSGATDTWTMNAGTFLELVWSGFAKEVSAPFVVWNELNGCTYDGFNTWLLNQDNGEHYHLLDDGTVVGHGGAGFSRPSDKINNSTEIDVEPELSQFVLNYVQYCTTQTDLGYKECYLYSYNFLSPSAFSTYAQYITTKEYLKNGGNRYSVIFMPNANQVLISQYLNQDQNLGFVGTTTNGNFTSVQPYVNWSTLGQYQLPPAVSINQAGTVSQVTNNNWYGYNNLKNTATPTSSAKIIMSPNEKNELVYVFATLNAYKNYNAGMPQPYYLTSSGMNTGTWTASGGGVINTGSMNNSGNYYSSVTSGVGSNWTPDQILALVDKVTSANGGSGGSGSSDKDNSKLWERIGNAIGNLIDGIVEVITTVIEKLSDALLSIIHLLTGYTDDNGIVHDGLFGKLIALVNGGFNSFISSIFSWLPEEIVTIFTATLVFGIFFGLFKLLRR